MDNEKGSKLNKQSGMHIHIHIHEDEASNGARQSAREEAGKL